MSFQEFVCIHVVNANCREFKVGDEIEVKALSVDAADRKIMAGD